MERPPQLRETSDENDAQRLFSERTRRDSFTSTRKATRKERPKLRSSPLAGPSFSADGAGNVIEHTSALEEEITRRRTMLTVLSDDELAALASPSTPALSFSSSPNRSRKGSLETNEESEPPRRARPSFISLSPAGSCVLLTPPSPTSRTLRARHSLPHLATIPKPSSSASGPGPANWMTAAPTPSFSRSGVRSSGVIMPVKASSRAGERIRLKSTPKQTTGVVAQPVTQPTPAKRRSLRSFRSMSRVLRRDDMTEHEKEIPSVPASPPSLCPSASSFESVSTSSPASPITSSDSISTEGHRQFLATRSPSIADPDSEPSLFSDEAETDQVGLEPKESTSRVRRLLSKVRKWRAQS